MDYGRLLYYDSSVVVILYYSKLAVGRRERKGIMRNKKLAVWFGLLSVLLMSLSAAAAPGLARTSPAVTANMYADISFEDMQNGLDGLYENGGAA